MRIYLMLTIIIESIDRLPFTAKSFKESIHPIVQNVVVRLSTIFAVVFNHFVTASNLIDVTIVSIADNATFTRSPAAYNGLVAIMINMIITEILNKHRLFST